MAFHIPSATPHVPTEEELRSSPRVHFSPSTLHTVPAECRVQRSPPPEPSCRSSSRLLRDPAPPPSALAHRSSPGKHSSRIVPKIKRRVQRSPPSKPSRSSSSRPLRAPSPPPSALVHRSSSGKHSSRVVPKKKMPKLIVTSVKCVKCDSFYVPGFKPNEYLLVDVVVAQEDEDICDRASPDDLNQHARQRAC
ncbi:hypothetical protein AcV5_008798 [Taiwanofungus camphoratus]|nr:hypothetical protein AcV5_008798 [Antrodia cinnamomea]